MRNIYVFDTVCNAGIMYATSLKRSTPEEPLRSKQGYDLAFATNYMVTTELQLNYSSTITPQ